MYGNYASSKEAHQPCMIIASVMIHWHYNHFRKLRVDSQLQNIAKYSQIIIFPLIPEERYFTSQPFSDFDRQAESNLNIINSSTKISEDSRTKWRIRTKKLSSSTFNFKKKISNLVKKLSAL